VLRVGVFLSAAVFTLLSLGVAGRSPSVELTLRATPGWGQQSVTPAELEQAAGIIRARLRGLALTGTVTVRSGSDLLVVRIAGRDHVSATAIRLITESAQLMFFDFEADLTGPSKDAKGNPVASPSLYRLLTQLEQQTPRGAPQGYYLFRSKTARLLRGPTSTLRELLRPDGGQTPAGTRVLTVPAHEIIVACPGASGCLGATTSSATDYYALKYVPLSGAGQGSIPELTGADLVQRRTHSDVGTVGHPIVLLQFTDHGSKVFERITRAEAQRGAAKYGLAGKRGDHVNYVQHFAIVLDGVLESTPYIDFQQNPDGIPGPNAEIDIGPGATLRDAKNLALVLQSGALPLRLVVASKRAVP
jgi:SecD/SecF fusion protein